MVHYLINVLAWIVSFYFESIFTVKNYSQQTKRSESFHWTKSIRHYLSNFFHLLRSKTTTKSDLGRSWTETQKRSPWIRLSTACKVLRSLKNIDGILVCWVVSLDAAKSKQCLDASVSKIQNVLEHYFQALFKLCLTDPCLSKVTYRQLTKNHRDASFWHSGHIQHSSWGGLNLYTQQKLLCFGLFTRELYLFVYKCIHYDDRLHVRKSEKMHVITWRLLTLMDSTSVYGASCPTQEVAINFVFK